MTAIDERESYLIDEVTGCWLWQMYMDPNGYGRVWDGTRMEWAHRAFYRRVKGPIPAGYEIDHVCQQTACVNPDHLDAVTKVEHARRTMTRLGKDDLHGRAAALRVLGLTYSEIADVLEYQGRGSACCAVKAAIAKGLVAADELPIAPRLTSAEVDDIRVLYGVGIPQTEIARWYRRDSSQISRVCSRVLKAVS